MSPTSCRCSTPRQVTGPRRAPARHPHGGPAAASPPPGFPPEYSPALRWVTTGFGMDPGGSTALSATDPPCASQAGTPRPPVTTHVARCDADTRSWTAHRPPRRERGTSVRPAQPPSAMSTARLRSVARRPPAASQPPRLGGAFPLHQGGGSRFGEGFPLRCFQRFTRPDIATRRCALPHNRHTSGPSSPVLSY